MPIVRSRRRTPTETPDRESSNAIDEPACRVARNPSIGQRMRLAV